MSERFSVRMFGPGLAGGGQAAEAVWRAGHLELVLGESRWQVATADLTSVRASGFNHGQWQFAFSHEGADYACFIDAAAYDALFANAPETVRAHLAGARRQGRRSHRLLWTSVLLAVFLPLLALAWLGFNTDRVAGWMVDRIPLAQEKQLGDLVLSQTRLQMKLQDKGPAVDAVRQIGQQLIAAGGGSRFEYRWFVAEQPGINAFAAPGGVVVVFSGLIDKARSPEELAGVLAHEIAHAELRHSLRTMLKSLGLRALTLAVFGDTSRVLGDAAAGLTELKFSRDAEREADDHGFQRLLKAGVDPVGMVNFFELLEQETKASPPAFLSTHPDTAERIARLRARLPALPVKAAPLAVDLAAAKLALRKP